MMDKFIANNNGNINTDILPQLLNNHAQGYKIYWFEAILNLMCANDGDISFDDIIDEMISLAWYSVTHYHLHLGPSRNAKDVNLLEAAVVTLNSCIGILDNPSKETLKKKIKHHRTELSTIRKNITNCVPHRILRPFFETEELKDGLKLINRDDHKKLIEYINCLPENNNLLYTFVLDSEKEYIRLNKFWRDYLVSNYAVIHSWVQLNKVQFIQGRNPDVPAIVNKLDPESSEGRQLNEVRELWRIVSYTTGKPIIDIYTKNEINNKLLSIDHFVPRSYVSNDELWNLIPADRCINSSKNNKLAKWDDFFNPFVNTQLELYKLIFSDKDEYKPIQTQFNKCRKSNLNADWAQNQLYVENNSDEVFVNMLEEKLKPIYTSAKSLGYEIWNV